MRAELRETDDEAAGPIGRLLTWPVEHPWATIVLTLVAAVLALLSTLRLRCNGSLAAMFPKNDPAADALVHVLDDFPASDQLIVLATLPDSSPQPHPDRLIAFGHRFAAAVHQSGGLSRLTDGVYFQPDEDSRRFVEEVVAPNAMFYLDEPTFRAAQERLSTEAIRRQIQQDAVAMATPGPTGQALQKMVQLDPLRLHQFIMDRLARQRPFRTYQNGDAFVSPDGRSLLIRVIGTRPPSDLDYARALTSGVMRTAASVNGDGLKLQFTGSYPIAAASERAIRRDMIGSVIGSILLLQLLFLLAYRSSFKLFAMAFGPVALGILLGFGIYATVSPGLTPITAVLGAILAGMGIDYSIQYVSYYENRRIQFSDPKDAALETAGKMSPAVLAAWATSIVGFVAIGFSHVQALRDFAVLGTLGLTCAFLCVLFALPAVLMLSDKRPTPTISRLRFGASPLLNVLSRGRRLCTGVCAVLIVGAIVLIVRSHGDVLPLESDLTVMHPRPNPAIAAQYDVANTFGISPGSLAVYLHANDSKQLAALAYDVNARLTSPAARLAGITGTFGLSDLLPDPRIVPERIKEVAPTEADRVVKDFRTALVDNGFVPERFKGYADFLQLLVTRKSAPGLRDLIHYRRTAETVLPASAFAGREPTEAITMVFVGSALDQDRASRDRAIAAVRQALAGIPGATVTGLGVVAHDTEETVRTELPRLIWIAVLIVIAYLAVHFRNLFDACLSLVPAIFGIVIGAAALRLLGERLNMVNLVAVPLLIGIDVDYGIFLVSLSRWRRIRGHNAEELQESIEPPVHAVIVCATATILGYVSLIWTSVPAERSLGVAAAVGVGACLVGVLFLLIPLFFSLAGRR